MFQLRVLIIGASIAGPTTAYWLAKTGARITVIERSQHLRTGGQNVDIRTVGVSVMRKIPGMEAAVRAKTTGEEGVSWVRDHGTSYGTLRATGNPDQQSLVSEFEIFPGDLARILFDLTKEDGRVEYMLGEQVAAMQPRNEKNDDGPVTVEFANGLPIAEYDLVVACDGATSRTRAIGLGCGVRDYIEPTNCWAAYFSIDQDILKGSKVAQGYSAPGGRSIGVGPDPSGVNRVGLFAINRKEDRDATLPFRQAMKQGDDALKTFVAKHYKGMGWKADEIMSGMMESKDFYASEVVQVKPPSLYKGRFVLVGDAGYAPGFTGGGTSLAMAGAYVLAGEVGRHKGDLAAGLRAYEDRMRPIITELQKVPPLIPTVMGPQTAGGIWLRNNIFAFVVWTGFLEFAQKYFAGAFASSVEHPLPEYVWVD